MKPFNLEAAKRGEPVQTKDGRKARILAFDRSGPTFPVVGLITQLNGYENMQVWDEDGRVPRKPSYLADDISYGEDLVMVPKKIELVIMENKDFPNYSSFPYVANVAGGNNPTMGWKVVGNAEIEI